MLRGSDPHAGMAASENGRSTVELHPVAGARTSTWISHFCERPGLAPGRTLRQSPSYLNPIGASEQLVTPLPYS